MNIELENIIKKHLDKEILNNEIIRTRILEIFFGICFITFSVFVPLFKREEFLELTQSKVPIYGPMIFFFCIYLFFYTGRKILLNFKMKNKKLPLFSQYINAFIETSIPSAAILITSFNREPATIALLIPPNYVYFIFIILSALRLNRNLCFFTGFVASFEYLIISMFIIEYFQTQIGYGLESFTFQLTKSGIMFFSGITIGLVTDRIKNKLIEGFNVIEDRNRIEGIFGQHVSPSVVDQLINNKSEFINEMKEVSVLFFDIRNFTSYSESKKPDEVVEYLNQIFSICIEIINTNNGIINKFLGDGFMAVFGAPINSGEDSTNAIQASIQIKERLNSAMPATKFGIGIHSGFALTGNIGSAIRKEYTIIGDVVNVASRIEQLNKNFESDILISEYALKEFSRDFVQDLGSVKLKGRDEEIKIFKIN